MSYRVNRENDDAETILPSLRAVINENNCQLVPSPASQYTASRITSLYCSQLQVVLVTVVH